jgi:hypothetical protein
MEKKISSDKAEEFVIQLLQTRGKLTTVEVKGEMNNLGLKCEDGPARVLSQLKTKGEIHGKFSLKARGWIWWV